MATSSFERLREALLIASTEAERAWELAHVGDVHSSVVVLGRVQDLARMAERQAEAARAELEPEGDD